MKEPWGKIRLEKREHQKEEIRNIDMRLIHSNPYQPRKIFEEEKIMELAQSIKTYGLLQPIILTPDKEGYCIIAGERRFMACNALGWTEIPAIIREYKGSSMAAVALIENLQREDLNFMEEAQGYKRLIDEFDLTQEVLAQRLGKSQSTIANKLRLLKLPDNIKEIIKQGNLSERHARALLKLNSEEKQQEAVSYILKMDLNVKETEKLINELAKKEAKKDGGSSNQRKVVIRDLRIFLNTIRQAINIIRRAGLTPQVDEVDEDNYFEIRIRLPKKQT
ncbi:MAG TPA: nucleoid occlusion protein [Firmicutes bacterium]|jgi:ParB family chromosome partitioning protein|nr:nucleoid occlusion protein [Bacillota bacterium]HAA34598.1 nucleoid occlusion protein [Bacillota bacterium]